VVSVPGRVAHGVHEGLGRVHGLVALRIKVDRVEVHLGVIHHVRTNISLPTGRHTSMKIRGSVLGKFLSEQVPLSGPPERYATCDLWSGESLFTPSQHLRHGEPEVAKHAVRSLRREVLWAHIRMRTLIWSEARTICARIPEGQFPVGSSLLFVDVPLKSRQRKVTAC
jgi:hypothetical protein